MVTEPARILLGDVEVTRVPEYAGKSPATPGFLFPDSGPASGRTTRAGSTPISTTPRMAPFARCCIPG